MAMEWYLIWLAFLELTVFSVCITRLQRGYAQLLKWEERALGQDEELKNVKQTKDYTCTMRLYVPGGSCLLF